MADVIEEVVDEVVDEGAVSPEVTVNPNDPLLTGVENDRKNAISTTAGAYASAIKGVDTMVADQQAAIDNATQTQIDAQNQYTEDTVNIIEGQKEEARDDYDDETRGAYVDWKQATDPFGVNAEKMAANGLSGSGYSESSKVRMFQAYQSRKALAYKAFTKAITEYNNQITLARSQNSVTIAQIASDAIKEKAKIALEGFYYKNNLIIEKTNAINTINQNADKQYLDVLDYLTQQAQDERDFKQHQAELDQAQANWQAEFNREGEENAQDQANWEALYGENGLYRTDEEEEEDIIINKGDTKPDIPTLSTGNPSLDRMTGVANGSGISETPSYNYANFNPTNAGAKNDAPVSNPTNTTDSNPTNTTGKKSLDDYPNYPKFRNGRSAVLTWETVGSVDNVRTVDRSKITGTLGNISAEKLDELVQKGYVKEVFFEDKYGKIGLTFEIVNKNKALTYLGIANNGTNLR